MRILILADIHANWPALKAIQEPHDLCFFVGDIVDYGLEPVPCIEWVEKHASYLVRGNHDHAVAQRVLTNGKNGFKYLSGVTRQLTWERLQSTHLRYLGALPVTRMVTQANTRFLLVHATPRDPLDEYVVNDPELWARRLQRVTANVVCVGHSHQQYLLQVGDKLVINPGSVGQPRDGDPRAAYAIWEDGKVELKRVAYPIEETVKTIQNSSLPDLAKQMAIHVLRTGSSSPISPEGVETPQITGGLSETQPVIPAPAEPRPSETQVVAAPPDQAPSPGPQSGVSPSDIINL